MKNLKNYTITLFFVLTLNCFLDHNLQAGGIFSWPMVTGETVKNYDEFLERAQALDRNNRFEDALKLYNEIIAAPETISTKLRFKARLHKAKTLYAQAKTAQNQQQHSSDTIRRAEYLLEEIIKASFDQVDKNDWAQARLLDAEIEEYHSTSSLEQDASYYAGCRLRAVRNYSKILREESLNIDPALMFQAAYRWGKLCYNFPQDGLMLSVDKAHTSKYIFNEMLKAYTTMTRDQQQASVVDTQEFNQLKKWGNNARLHCAEKLLHTQSSIDLPDYTQALQLNNDIINSPESDVDPETVNAARVNLAGMYLRGEGTAINIDEAQSLYACVLDQPQNNVSKAYHSRAKVGFNLISKRKNRNFH